MDLKVIYKIILKESARISNVSFSTKDDIDKFVEKLVSIINKFIKAFMLIQKITT